jgi:L-ascorbate metabolism protein UlaG (beta-lactamase superfamily)
MKSEFCKGEALQEEIRRACKEGRQKIWWLGQSGFLWVQNGRGILFDPYLSDSLTQKYAGSDKPHVRITERVITPEALGELGIITLITSSHNHTDHCDATTLIPLLNANAVTRLMVPAANRSFVSERLGNKFDERLIEIEAHRSLALADIVVEAVPAAHPSIERDEEGRCRFLGYVVRWNGTCVYHSGDTLFYEGMAAVLRRLGVDLALLPINGDRPERRVAGNLDGRQAANLAHEIGAKCVIPCHYDLFEFNTADPSDFVAECKRLDQGYQVLQNGEAMELK